MKYVLVALMGWACVTLQAGASTAEVVTPPPMPEEMRAYFEKALKAERLESIAERCDAYPDLPGNHWPAKAAWARCSWLRTRTFSLDEFESMLDGPDAPATIEAHLSKLLADHYADPNQRDQIYAFFRIFDASERSGALAARWLREAPDSPYAMTALGTHRARLGWEARGEAYAKDTSPQQLQRMRQHFAAALPLLFKAFEKEPSLGPACLELAKMGRQSSDLLQQVALSQCLDRDPLSFNVVFETMKASQPKWGGSMEAMIVTAEYVRTHGPQNPSLYTLMAEPLEYVIDEKNRPYGKALDDYLRGADLVPRPGMLEGAGFGTKDLWRRAMLLSQALRFAPERGQARQIRYETWWSLAQWDWAMVDLEWLVKRNPDNVEYQHNLGYLLLLRGRAREALPHLRAALALPGAPELTYVYLCSALVHDEETEANEEMRSCTARSIAEHPDSKDVWAWRTFYLMETGDYEGATETVARFKLLADLSDPEDVRYLEETERRLEATRK